MTLAAPLYSVDLTTCDREPIHILGHVQPFGFLLALTPDLVIVSASANAGDFLCEPERELAGQPLHDILDESALTLLQQRIEALRQSDIVERIFGVRLRRGGGLFDLAVHLSGGVILIDGEPSVSERDLNASDFVRTMLVRLRQTQDFDGFCREGARQVKTLTGFDRVMVYRFDPDGAGEVIAEAAEPHLVKFLGLHYPASDIPKQARILYERNWLRIIPDINAAPVPLVPPSGPRGPIDLSMSVTRAVSPIHIEYLQNMGVGASLSISILRDGKLWGLFACHHYSARHISLERRTAAELFGQMFSWILESREREQDVAAEARARAINERVLSEMAGGAASIDSLAASLNDLRAAIDCDGAAVWNDGDITLTGKTPTREEFAALVRFLNGKRLSGVFATNELGKYYAPAADFPERAAGLLAVPISWAPRDYLMFFRAEVARSVNWAGDPTKPATLGPNGARLTPRKSFETWQETVRGQSAHWRDADVRIAEALRVALLEIVLRITDAAEKERRNSQERQELLIAELNHRVRNILSLIRGLINQGKNSTITAEEFANVVGGRIQALARAHDQITKTNWAPGGVRKLVESETEAYLGNKAARLNFSGPDVALEPEAFVTLALVVHELVTNSAKYGALSDSTGAVDIGWSLDGEGQLVLSWQERGGPPVTAPKRRGFGSTIIERSIPYDLAGKSEIHYELLGVRAQMTIPARYVHRDAGASIAAEEAQAPLTQRPFDGSVLVLEDNLIIAMDAEAIVEKLGASRIDVAASVKDALRAIAANKPDFALLDINLGSETSMAVAARLQELGVPFAFTTGYGDRAPLPPEFKDVPVIQKPYTPEAIVAKMPLR